MLCTLLVVEERFPVEAEVVDVRECSRRSVFTGERRGAGGGEGGRRMVGNDEKFIV